MNNEQGQSIRGVKKMSNSLQTRRGVVHMPAYMPVTTWGSAYPTDRLLQPFLRRHAQMVMVSPHFAKEMPEDFAMPTFIDSGGFALLLEGSSIEIQADGTGAIVRQADPESGVEADRVDKEGVLALQERLADFGATLDFPIPMSMKDEAERARRIDLTLRNAAWALASRRRQDLRLFGSVQGWDADSYVSCARQLVTMGFADLAIGGLVQRIQTPGMVLSLVTAVREVVPAGGLLHCFGIGEPTLAAALFEAGATSVDSSSYIRSAVSGRRWDAKEVPAGASPLERVNAALANLEFAVKAAKGQVEVQDPEAVPF